jgi:DUF971 family protein
MDPINRPRKLDLDRERGLTVTWPDDTTTFYPIAYLRKMSPSADMREIRDQMDSNPLAVIPEGVADLDSVTAEDAELVGNYAIRIRFSDGHETGIFSWNYLRSIAPDESPGE